MNLHVGTCSHLDNSCEVRCVFWGSANIFTCIHQEIIIFGSARIAGKFSRKMMNNMYKFNVYINMGSEHRQ